LTGIHNPKQSFKNELLVALDELKKISPENIDQVLRALLWIGAHIVIDEPTCLKNLVENVKTAMSLVPEEKPLFAEYLASKLFPGES
jgi:hypothetical protein